ncbi:MAG: anti-sigma factor family protein [Pyrinomonadaceae bacterium]
MKCANLQFNLSVYLDNYLTADEHALLEDHLAQCPLCRQKSADFQSLRTDLRVLPRPEMPNDLLVSMRNRI